MSFPLFSDEKKSGEGLNPSDGFPSIETTNRRQKTDKNFVIVMIFMVNGDF